MTQSETESQRVLLWGVAHSVIELTYLKVNLLIILNSYEVFLLKFMNLPVTEPVALVSNYLMAMPCSLYA